jgi:hypothetical protein
LTDAAIEQPAQQKSFGTCRPPVLKTWSKSYKKSGANLLAPRHSA